MTTWHRVSNREWRVHVEAPDERARRMCVEMIDGWANDMTDAMGISLQMLCEPTGQSLYHLWWAQDRMYAKAWRRQ